MKKKSRSAKREEYVAEIMEAYEDAVRRGEALDLTPFDLTPEEIETIRLGPKVDALLKRAQEAAPETYERLKQKAFGGKEPPPKGSA